MKLLVFASAFLVLAGGVSTPALVAAHWQAFTQKPEQTQFDLIYHDVKTCPRADCPAATAISWDMINALDNLVQRENPLAVRLAMAARELVSNNAAGSEDLDQSFSHFILDQPVTFLKLAQDEGFDARSAVLATGEDLVDDFTAQVALLKQRRALFQKITAVDLLPIRDRLLAALDKDIADISPMVGTPDDLSYYNPPSVPLDISPLGKPTLDRPPVTQMRLGDMTIVLEETALIDIQKHLGAGDMGHKGDASEALKWLCYTVRDQNNAARIWLTSDEMGGGRVDGIVMVAMNTSEPSADACPDLDAKTYVPVLEHDIQLNMPLADVLTALGPPSGRSNEWLRYAYEGTASLKDASFNVFNEMDIHLKSGRVDHISVYKMTQN